MFCIEVLKFGQLDLYVLKNSRTQEKVGVFPQLGANINELVLSNGTQNFDIVDGNTNPELLVRNEAFKGCKLSPFPNRIKEGKYQFAGNTYHLNINNPPNALHGFIFQSPFEVVQQIADDSCAQIILKHTYHGDYVGYPFKFDITIEITLDSDGLKKATTITNTGTENMPLGDGWHLYFKTKSKLDDCLLQFPSEQIVESDKNLIPTGKYQTFQNFVEPKRINGYVFDDCFLLNTKKKNASVKLTDTVYNYTIEAWQQTGENGYNFLQIYIPPHRNSIAIEPMTCEPNAFNSNKGIIELKSGETLVTHCGVRVLKSDL